MSTRTVLFSWLLLSGLAWPMLAQAQMGVNGLTYRMGDPFVFCTQGQGWTQAPEQCWIPLPPYTNGTFMMMPWCDPPNTYGKPWSQDDYASLAQYQSICPLALTPGAWTGAGQPEQVPFQH